MVNLSRAGNQRIFHCKMLPPLCHIYSHGHNEQTWFKLICGCYGTVLEIPTFKNDSKFLQICICHKQPGDVGYPLKCSRKSSLFQYPLKTPCVVFEFLSTHIPNLPPIHIHHWSVWAWRKLKFPFKICFNLTTLTFDLWPWPSNLTYISFDFTYIPQIRSVWPSVQPW